MARLPYAPEGTPGSDHPLNLFRMIAHSQPFTKGFLKLGHAILFESTLDPRLREIAILRVGMALEADYEVTKHVGIGKSVGLTDAEIAALRPGSSLDALGAAALAVVRFSDDLGHRARASDEALENVRVHLDDRAVVELTLTIGFYHLVCRFLETLGVDPE